MACASRMNILYVVPDGLCCSVPGLNLSAARPLALAIGVDRYFSKISRWQFAQVGSAILTGDAVSTDCATAIAKDKAMHAKKMRRGLKDVCIISVLAQRALVFPKSMWGRDQWRTCCLPQ